MGFGYSKAEAAELERLAAERGGSVRATPVRYPAEAPVEIETRMAWSEKHFQAEVVKLAKANGWKVYHTWLSIRSEKGWPDLAMVRLDRTVFAELKKQKGKETHEQKAWRAALMLAGHDCRLWRPSCWEEIEATLARPQ